MCRKGKKITRPKGETGVSEVEKQSCLSQAQAYLSAGVRRAVRAPQGSPRGRALERGFWCQSWWPSGATWPIAPPDCGLTAFPPALSCAEEIVAHASNVSSLVLGKGSGRLLATGGDDCRVNLWSINKPNCIMVSLAGQGQERGAGGDWGQDGVRVGEAPSSGGPSRG